MYPRIWIFCTKLEEKNKSNYWIVRLLMFLCLFTIFCVIGEENPCARATCPWSGSCVSRSGVAQCTCPSCDTTLAPVCSSDHNTYGNECKMRAHACTAGLREGDLRVLYNGTCRTYKHIFITCKKTLPSAYSEVWSRGKMFLWLRPNCQNIREYNANAFHL